MFSFILQRLVIGIVTLFGVAVIVFVIMVRASASADVNT